MKGLCFLRRQLDFSVLVSQSTGFAQKIPQTTEERGSTVEDKKVAIASEKGRRAEGRERSLRKRRSMIHGIVTDKATT